VLLLAQLFANDVGAADTPPEPVQHEFLIRNFKTQSGAELPQVRVPLSDARYEASSIPRCQLLPIPSLWGHTAGARASPEDAKFLNQQIGRFLRAGVPRK
jgi:hypothetical protein